MVCTNDSLKSLNNWTKSVILDRVLRRGDRVLDICGGKGGDLKKMAFSGVKSVVLIDNADQSVKDANMRYDEMVHKSRRMKMPSATFIVADCHRPFDESITKKLLVDNYAPFDVVSCQFALAYSFVSEERARGLLQNVSQQLKVGGHFVGTIPDARVFVQKLRQSPDASFGNEIYKVKFHYTIPRTAPTTSTITIPSCDSKCASEPTDAGTVGIVKKYFDPSQPFGIDYDFSLLDAIDTCPEYLVHFRSFVSLAKEYGLQLVESVNFQQYFDEHHKNVKYSKLLDIMQVLESTDRTSATSPTALSQAEWDVAGMYLTFTFVKIN